MQGLGAALMRGIALGLGLPESFFQGPNTAGPEQGYWCVRVIHYPPLAQGTYHAAQGGGGGDVADAAKAAAAGAEVPRSVRFAPPCQLEA
jgi:isopenicillin N synthase-like dioxygenase